MKIKPILRTFNPDEFDPRLKDSVFFVEANSFERHALWREHGSEERPMDGAVDWKEDNMGLNLTIGHFGDMPVCVSFFFDILNGKRICFYEMTSMVTHSQMFDDFFNKYINRKYDNDSRRALTDAQNFHLALSVVK